MKKDQVKVSKLPLYRAANSKVIAVMNNKGGCGKTTTAISIGLHLARLGHNVLFWDNDPQSNLTQRLGLSDEKSKDKRLNYFFRNADLEDYENEQKKLSLVVKYPYFYRISGSQKPPGTIGIVAGSHVSEIEATAAYNRLALNTYLEPEQRNIFRFFKKGVRFYCDYFDFIIMDTAPAMEGNILCQLAARTADEIVCPVDGLEAATGVKQLLSWMYSETSPEKGVTKRPNMLFAMVKYQEDTKNFWEVEPALKLKNVVYRAMKAALGDYVCDNGIKELPTLRNKVYDGFGRKTHYEELCNEIVDKMSKNRPNIFDHWNPHIASRFQESLAKIEMKSLEKRPEFKNPYFEPLEKIEDA